MDESRGFTPFFGKSDLSQLDGIHHNGKLLRPVCLPDSGVIPRSDLLQMQDSFRCLSKPCLSQYHQIVDDGLGEPFHIINEFIGSSFKKFLGTYSHVGALNGTAGGIQAHNTRVMEHVEIADKLLLEYHKHSMRRAELKPRIRAEFNEINKLLGRDLSETILKLKPKRSLIHPKSAMNFAARKGRYVPLMSLDGSKALSKSLNAATHIGHATVVFDLVLRSNAVITAENKPREAAIQLGGAAAAYYVGGVVANATILLGVTLGATGGVTLLVIAGGAALLGGMAADTAMQTFIELLWDNFY